jgi:hypothetical protein
MWALIYFGVLLLLIIAFILVGVNAFGMPGMFGSLINSVFPMGKIFYFWKFKFIFIINNFSWGRRFKRC